MKPLPVPRYGSAAQLASYAGLSVKTVRRLVDAGKVRGIKVGSRLLIPFEDVDRLILRAEDRSPRTQERSAMAIANTTAPPAAIDPATGRLLPMSDAQRKARSEALGRALDAMAAMTDETDTDLAWRDVFRGIDEGRPHRPLFEGEY
jgi:excisionase family DNA binding protein